MSPIVIANKEREHHDKNGMQILEGSLVCSHSACQQEYPIIDGVPLLVPYVTQYVNDNFYHITLRGDISSHTSSILGDIAGPGAAFNEIRHYLSCYAWDHYADLAPVHESTDHGTTNHGTSNHGTTDDKTTPQRAQPGSIVACLQAGLGLYDRDIKGPVLDIGCAVGRTSFELAKQSNGLCLGIDLNFSMLRLAQRILTEGKLSYPLKRTGIVFDQQAYPLQFDNVENVDFWVCDAMALPFADEEFACVTALNVIDTVNSARDFLTSVRNTLQPEGTALISTPYDWQPPVPVRNWLGGHSQRGPEYDSSESVMRKLLGPGHPMTVDNLKIEGEIDRYPWTMRIHSRRTVCYESHIIACRKT